ncbi:MULTISPECIES: MarR family winged helix-turn-helix transcriptional regulator [Paenibacillus]|uniref:MarR family winged helix-turn-helix transcriptional regulator n=1 Tax=Paenibacillus TaxID=44249 RepID=UPI001F470169|nr:MarR family transcriptional regulator [Paenibacillus sp. JJ-223]CAH1190696.1 HTH-type transcriptional regulator MhqR [Paenibacillus sp. JJ-223]
MNLSSEELYGYALTKTSRAILRFLTGHLKRFSITPEQWTVLKRVFEHEGITQKELAVIADKDPATLAKILDNLERNRLIVRQTNRQDRRSYLIFITEDGTKLRNEVEKDLEQVFDQVLEGITEDELTMFSRVLSRIEKNAIAHTQN